MRYAIHNKYFAADDGSGSGGGQSDAERTAELESILEGGFSTRKEAGGEGDGQQKQFTEGDKGGEGQQKPDSKAGEASGDKKGEGAEKQGSEVKTEDVEKDVESKLFGTGKPEDEQKKLKRLYEASSKEGVRLSKQLQKVNELLEKQGVDLLIENGEPVGFVARKGAKGAAEPSVSLKDMPEEVRESFDSDPDKAIQWVWAKAKSAFARVESSGDVVAPISEERKQAAIEALAEETELDGEKSYPDAAKSAEQAVRFINGTGSPRELKNLYHKSPELAIKLISAFIENRTRAAEALIQRKAAKNNKAKEHPDMGASKTGVAKATASDWAANQGKAIAEASI